MTRPTVLVPAPPEGPRDLGAAMVPLEQLLGESDCLAPHNANASLFAAERVHANTIHTVLQALAASRS